MVAAGRLLAGLVLLAPLLAGCQAAGPPPPQVAQTPDACGRLAEGPPPGVRIASATQVGAPDAPWSPPAEAGSGSSRLNVDRPMCRLVGTIEGTIGFELWLPPRGAWNGRFLGTGVGGSAGFLNYADMTRGVRAGFAAASTDTGHGRNDQSWVSDPVASENYAHRAEHLLAVASKQLVARYYARPAAHAYFIGCSGGGRQALMEAQRYPADYDGIVAGAPGLDAMTLSARRLVILQIQRANPAGALSDADWQLVAEAGNRACDAQDGLVDGVADSLDHCRFDVASLQCAAGQPGRCLSPAQVDAAQRISRPLRTRDGRALDFGLLPGVGVREGAALERATLMFGRGVRRDPAWDPATFDLDRDMAAVDRVYPTMAATDPDLGAFRKRGGKIIAYHGWSDPSVPVQGSIDYLRRVQATMGGPATADALRLFLVPGMLHCGGGPATDRFGGAGDLTSASNADENMLDAIVGWVEKGRAPVAFTASRRVADKVVRTRPLCAYPQVARYRGSGDIDKAASFTCEPGPPGIGGPG